MTLFWFIAIIITLSAAIYQRLTGPTHPKRLELTTSSETYSLKFLRSHGGDEDCEMKFEIPDPNITGSVSYRQYPIKNEWITVTMQRDGKNLIARLPHQPPAGKLEYKVKFEEQGENLALSEPQSTVIRFKGGVPEIVLIPHVLLMFIAMLISNLAGILAIAGHSKMVFYTNLTFILVLIGGMIFGPIMQKYAFGEFWTGFPFGMDLTDNKTLIAFVFWIIAVIANLKKRRAAWIIIASIVMLAIYLIPHSMFGSELDYETGSVITGE